MKLSRPILRWHGGKWKLAPWIISNFSTHKVYVEPFGGAASVLLRKPRSYAEVYNDLDLEVVNLFRIVRSRGEDLKEQLKLTPFSRTDFVESYETSECELEQARRTVVRSFMGFGSNAHNKNTGFRACSNRSGTTPAHDWKNYHDCMDALIERLRGVVIENRDAMQVMKSHDSLETLHYVDPPYVSSTRDGGKDYRFEMDDQAHLDLAEFLKDLKGKVIISGYPSNLYNHLFADWNRVERKALADGAAPRTEVLWMNYEIEKMLL